MKIDDDGLEHISYPVPRFKTVVVWLLMAIVIIGALALCV